MSRARLRLVYVRPYMTPNIDISPFFFVQHAYYLDYKVCSTSHFLWCNEKLVLTFYVWQVSSNLAENICGASFSTLQDDRRTYITNFMDHLISWDTVTLRMMRAESFVNLGEPNIPVA